MKSIEARVVALAIVTAATYFMTNVADWHVLVLLALGWLIGALLIICPRERDIALELLAACREALDQMSEQYCPADDCEFNPDCEWCALHKKLERAVRSAEDAR